MIRLGLAGCLALLLASCDGRNSDDADSGNPFSRGRDTPAHGDVGGDSTRSLIVGKWAAFPPSNEILEMNAGGRITAHAGGDTYQGQYRLLDDTLEYEFEMPQGRRRLRMTLASLSGRGMVLKSKITGRTTTYKRSD
jgi:hypothetical protein